MANQDETWRQVQLIQRRGDICDQLGYIVAGAFGCCWRIAVAVAAQIERNHPVVKLELFQLVFPVGGTAAKAVDEHHGRLLASGAPVKFRASVQHAHFQRSVIDPIAI